jgi:hypothetical protein
MNADSHILLLLVLLLAPLTNVPEGGADDGVEGVALRLGDIGVARPEADEDDAPPPTPPLPSAEATLSRLAVAAAALRRERR